jgi:hypothetical protein
MNHLRLCSFNNKVLSLSIQYKRLSMVRSASGSLAIRVKSSAYNMCVTEEPVVLVTSP